MSIVDTIFVICSSIIGVYILGMFMVEWASDSELRRQMRQAGVSEEYIRETLRIVELGRSRARRVPRFSSLPGISLASRRKKARA